MILGVVVLITSLWLIARWLLRRPARERWLSIAVLLPLLGVPEHWWHARQPLEFYRSDGVATHLWLAAFQILGMLGAMHLASAPAGSATHVSRRDDAFGVVTTGLAGICAAMFILAYGDHAGTWVPPFPENTPTWWRTIGWHGWGLWFLTGVGFVMSSRAMRRGRAVGYIGLALVVSFVAFVHWETFQVDGAALGATRGSVIVILSVCALCWMLAGHRLFGPRRGDHEIVAP